MQPVVLPDAIRARIYAHARRAYPAECCGYLAGEPLVVVECHNAQLDAPLLPDRGADRGFAIAGPELLAFAHSFDGPAPARVVYHSHPNGRAYFSATDHALAASDGRPTYPVQHLVIGVSAARVTEVAQFAWSMEAGAYVEVARWSVP